MYAGTTPRYLHFENPRADPTYVAAAGAAAMSDEEKEREVRLQDYFDEQRRTARERMTVFAERGEAKRKYGRRPYMPPFEIIKFPGR
jgi:hypothetical protein